MASQITASARRASQPPSSFGRKWGIRTVGVLVLAVLYSLANSINVSSANRFSLRSSMIAWIDSN